MLLRRIADARVFNCEDDRGRLGVNGIKVLLYVYKWKFVTHKMYCIFCGTFYPIEVFFGTP